MHAGTAVCSELSGWLPSCPCGGLPCRSGFQCLKDPSCSWASVATSCPATGMQAPKDWQAHCAHSIVSGEDQRKASSLVLLKEEWL